MGVFYGTLASTYLFYLLARLEYDRKFKLAAIFWSILVAIILVLVSGLRSGIGDTPFYMHSFEILANNPASFKFEGDFALDFMSLLLMQISTDPQILIFTTALITNLLNVIMFNRYRSYLELQVYMYITSGYYIVTMNGLRQCLAAALLFACTKFIEDGKFIKYSICVLLISTFHGSAVMMIPLYFVVRQKAWSKKMWIFIALGVVGVLLYDYISPILFKALENTQYSGYSEFDEGGSSFMRLVVNMVPIILAYLKRKEISEQWNKGDIFVNISIINAMFVGLGMFNWIFNRLTLYLQLYNFVLVPYIIKNCFKGKERRMIYFIFIICYFIFFYYENGMGTSNLYSTKYRLYDLFYILN